MKPEVIITLVTVLMVAAMFVHSKVSAARSKQRREQQKIDSKFTPDELAVIRDVRKLKVNLAIDGTMDDRTFVQVYKVIMGAVYRQFKGRASELLLERLRAYKAQQWGQYDQLFKQVEKERNELCRKHIRLIQEVITDLTNEGFQQSQKRALANKDINKEILEFEINAQADKPVAQILKAKDKDFFKRTYSEFLKKNGELDIKLAQVPAQERQSVSFNDHQRCLRQRIFDGMQVHKGITQQELKAGVEHHKLS